ncbi:hypothetical protein ATKI12_2862 [Kitasatospora sp. Ki12]
MLRPSRVPGTGSRKRRKAPAFARGLPAVCAPPGTRTPDPLIKSPTEDESDGDE